MACRGGWLARTAVVASAIVAFGIGPATGQEQPLSVTYGPGASTAEGDYDYRAAVYLRVPAAIEDQLFLRIFDPDTGGEHDLLYGDAWNTEVRFTLFGGPGAGTLPVAPIEEIKDEDLRTGEILAERVIGSSSAFDDTWQTIASFTANQGEKEDGHFVFRLLVEGLGGDDANVYMPTLSLRDRRNLPPEGVEIVSFIPTVRIPDDEQVTELRFEVPADAERLTVRNFDAANGDVSFTTTYRSLALSASGQDAWQEEVVELLPDERGQPAAIVLGGGREIPNDVTVVVLDGAGHPCPSSSRRGHGCPTSVPYRSPTSCPWRPAMRSRSTPPARPIPTASRSAIAGS